MILYRINQILRSVNTDSSESSGAPSPTQENLNAEVGRINASVFFYILSIIFLLNN